MKEGPPQSKPAPQDKKDVREEMAKGLENYKPSDSLENQISGAGTFEELFAALDKAGGVQGSHTYYGAEQLKQLINEVRNGRGKISSSSITRTGGLREKVILLTVAESQGGHFEKEDATMPKAGDQVTLTKVSVQEGMTSGIASGSELSGRLTRDIRVGEDVLLSSGQTSKVRSTRTENGKTYIDTQTSTYEIS